MPRFSKEQLIIDAKNGFKDYASPPHPGGRNHVAFSPPEVEPTLVIKRPKTDKGAGLLRTEYEVARLLARHENDFSFDLPHAYTFNSDPLFAAFTMVPGEVMSNETVRAALSEQQRVDIGTRLGIFTGELARNIPPRLYEESVKGLPRMPEKVKRFFELQEQVRALEDTHPLKKICKQVSVRQLEYEERKSRPRLVTIHNDLHIENVALTNRKLTGVFDFDSVHLGLPEEALRFVPHLLGKHAVHAAMEAYQSITEDELEEELIRHRSRMHLAHFAIQSMQTSGLIPPRILDLLKNT